MPAAHRREFRHDVLRVVAARDPGVTIKMIAKDFGIEESKGEIDYTKKRPLGYEPDANEMEYVTNDVLIVCKALRQQFEQDLTKMTISSDGLNFAKGQIGKKRWQALFPGAGCIDR